ncbi:MAG: CHAP domain-containing protein [Sphingomonadaceae bacterium]|nr:CHAP domain-containing protein [Sphingomonadaceae bacterium]
MVSGRFAGFLGLFAFAFFIFGEVAPAQARWQCVTYARHVSDFEIRGNAHTWWAQAEDLHERGSIPETGSVMVLRPHGRMRLGHVAFVREVVNDRQIRLNHANWSSRGMVESNVLAEDVSPDNDWSVVKVWHTPTGQLGITNYPVYGFIYADAAGTREDDLIGAPLQIAAHLDEPASLPRRGRTALAARAPSGGGGSANQPRDLIGDLLTEVD